MKRKLKQKFIKILILLTTLTVYFSVCASRTLVNVGVSYFEAQISTASYIAIGKALETNDFSDLFSFQKDKDGNIVLITTNGVKINALTKKLADEAFTSYSVYAEGGVIVPVGAFSGITFLSGFGKKVNIRMITVNSVRCEFRSEFESCGINQTKQSMYIKIIPDCVVVAGLKKKTIEKNVEVLCYENYILGKVPETYLNTVIYTSK